MKDELKERQTQMAIIKVDNFKCEKVRPCMISQIFAKENPLQHVQNVRIHVGIGPKGHNF